MRLYLDTAPIIYLIEGTALLRDSIAARLAGTRDGRDSIVVSPLSRLECRVKPMQDQNLPLLDLYDRFFAAEGIEAVSVDDRVWDMATGLRARYRLRVPDALHVACAVVHRCDRILTNDHRLDRVQEIPVEILTP